MSSDTRTLRAFLNEPIGKKPVTDLPGIGPVLGERLKAKEFDKAEKVMAQYLILDRNQERFELWLREKCQARNHEVTACYNGLNEWCNKYLN